MSGGAVPMVKMRSHEHDVRIPTALTAARIAVPPRARARSRLS